MLHRLTVTPALKGLALPNKSGMQGCKNSNSLKLPQPSSDTHGTITQGGDENKGCCVAKAGQRWLRPSVLATGGHSHTWDKHAAPAPRIWKL